MRRKDREMDEDFALMVLDKCEYAVLATADREGLPYCIPVTIVRKDDNIFIHSAPEGHKTENLRKNPKVCLTAIGDTHILKNEFTTEFESAVVFGTAEELTEREDKIEALRLLCERHVPTNMAAFDEAISASLQRTGVWKIHMESISGKRKKYDAKGEEMKFMRKDNQDNRKGRMKQMERKIIKIDEAKCNGCGLCAEACHEGAIGMVGGKAKLLREDYCDGLGDCLPACPTNAITFEMREAPAYDHAAVMAAKAKAEIPCGCPGSQSKAIQREEGSNAQEETGRVESQLAQWPVQIKLVPVNAPYFNGARLLIAADCTAFAYGNFHEEFIKGRITLVGCPKLDEGDYGEKLTAILKENDIKSVTVTRMEVPCCGGLENAVKRALADCGKLIPWQVTTISTDGRILDEC